MPELRSPTPKAKRQPFTEVLTKLSYGGLAAELTDELNELVHAVTETGKVGELTLSLKLKPINKGGQIEITGDIKTKRPKLARAVSLMFATPDNNLSQEHPLQQSLEGLSVVQPASVTNEQPAAQATGTGL